MWQRSFYRKRLVILSEAHQEPTVKIIPNITILSGCLSSPDISGERTITLKRPVRRCPKYWLVVLVGFW